MNLTSNVKTFVRPIFLKNKLKACLCNDHNSEAQPLTDTLFILDGKPIPLARPRFFRRGAFNVVYDSQKRIKNKFITQLKSQKRKRQWDILNSELSLDIVFFMPIPKSLSKKKQKLLNNKWSKNE